MLIKNIYKEKKHFSLSISIIFLFLSLFSNITPKKIDTNKLNEVLLAQHNKYRKIHGVDNLVLDNELIKLAQDYSAVLAYKNDSHYIAPSGNKNKNKEIVGENIFTCTSIVKPYCYSENSTKPVDDWYNEIYLYNFTDPGFRIDTAHFTQIVWKETTKIGCGASVQSDGFTYKVVCNYYKAGNMINTTIFSENVLPPNISCLYSLKYYFYIIILLLYFC